MGLAAGSRLGRYEIGALIGAGGMGEVYRAHDPTLRRDVAVKVLPERLGGDGERQRRFEREARAAAELEHPNVVAVYDVGVDGGVPFIVTELLDGATLAEALRRGLLPRARAIEIAVQIARGVAAAHEKGIVHRDLKPSNVFLCRDGRVKILDFGLAAHVESPATDDTVTETGAVLGTPAYMSPEQVRGQRVDSRADLFALGAILYEMVTGRRPFPGDSGVELAHAILSEEPEPLGDPALDAIVRRCLAKDPAARLRAAADLVFELETFASPRKASTSAPRRPWVMLGVGAALAAAAAALGWAVAPSRGGGPAVRYTRVTFHYGAVAGARFSPDGRTVIYSPVLWRADPRLRGVFETTPGRPEARPLTEPGTKLVAVSAAGDMLVSIGLLEYTHVLARVPLAGGVPRILYDDVIAADFSPDGSELAVVRKVGEKNRLEYPVGHVLFATSARIMRPRVSPRGDQVAFILRDSSAFNSSGTVEIVSRDGARKTLGTRWTLITHLAWAPDGHEVWVTGRRAAFRSIYAVSLDGRERPVLELPSWLIVWDIARDGRVLIAMSEERLGIRALIPGRSTEIDVGWYDKSVLADLSPDGRLTLFTSAGESSQERQEAFVRKTDGSAPVDLGAGAAYALSPDGAWALVGPATGLQSSLVLVPTGAGEPRHLPPGTIEQFSGGFFLGDGRRIVVRARATAQPWRLWIQDLDGGEPRPISDGIIAVVGRPAPEGDLVPACRIDGSCALFPVSGGAPKPLPAFERLGWPLQVTPDRQSLLVGRPTSFIEASAPPALWLVDLGTGSERLLRELPLVDPGADFDWDSVRLTRDASGYAYTTWTQRSDLVVADGLL